MDEIGFRFAVGQKVFVRDKGHGPNGSGFKIEEATVREQHFHPGRHPWYPNGEGYALDGMLWWDCYPGCRVFGTRAEAVAARLPEGNAYYDRLAAKFAEEIRLSAKKGKRNEQLQTS